MSPRAKRRRESADPTSIEAAVKFSSATSTPYNLLSNFFGDAELHFMAARFEHPFLKSLLVHEFATCTVSKFRDYFRQLYPSGKSATYVRTAPDGTQIATRGVLGRLAGTAAVSSSAAARKRMEVLRRLAGLSEDEEVTTNTAKIMEAAGLGEGAGQEERERAIEEFNDELMWESLKRKFRKGHCSEDGVEFRSLLLGTGDRRLREVTGRGGRWSARGKSDGALGEMLARLREEIRKEEEEEEDGNSPSDKEVDEECGHAENHERFARMGACARLSCGKRQKERSEDS